MFSCGKAGQHTSYVGSLSTCIVGPDKYEELQSSNELCECKLRALPLILTLLRVMLSEAGEEGGTLPSLHYHRNAADGVGYLGAVIFTHLFNLTF